MVSTGDRVGYVGTAMDVARGIVRVEPIGRKTNGELGTGTDKGNPTV